MACRWLSSWQQLLEGLLLVLEYSAPAGVEILRCKHKGSAFLQLITATRSVTSMWPTYVILPSCHAWTSCCLLHVGWELHKYHWTALGVYM